MARYQAKCMYEVPSLPAGRTSASITPRSILLINPFYAKDPNGSYGKHVLTPSLALSSIAAATPANWTVKYWDENLLQGPPPSDPFPQVVGITVHLTFAKRAYELAAWYRAGGAKVILGGLHVSSCPDEAETHADAIAVGDGVTLWPEILKDVENDRLRKRYQSPFNHPFSLDPEPLRALIDPCSFLTTLSVIATRGCHNRCKFCYLSTLGDPIPYQCRDLEQVRKAFVEHPSPYGVFIDNNLGSDPDYILALCKALKSTRKIWSAAVSIDLTDRPDVIREMALAGCTGVFIGFESLNAANLHSAGKRSPDPSDYARRVKLFRQYGIEVNGSFVLGFDNDGPESFDALIRWINETKLACATFHILTPYPRTPLFRELEREDRILHRDWGLYDTAHVVFRPKRMSEEQLKEGYEKCYRELFSWQSIWGRRPEALSALFPYFLMTMLYKRANWLWPFLIRYRLTGIVWRPLIELARLKHLYFRWQLEKTTKAIPCVTPLSPGV